MGTSSGRLYYSVVDMSLANGLGAVAPGRKAVFLDSMLSEKLTATVGNHCNIWVVSHTYSTPAAYKAYEITTAGVNPTPIISSVGTLGSFVYRTGQSIISSDGKKIVSCNLNGGLELCDFDARSGTVTNAVTLDNSSGYYSSAFSRDDLKLYAGTSTGKIMQYDLTAANIAGSKTELGASVNIGGIKLAPDHRIYFISSEFRALGRIELPNLAGPACQLTPAVVDITTAIGLPNIVPVLIQGTASFRQQIDVCFKDQVLLEADGSGWDFSWSDGTTDRSFLATADGIYTVTYKTSPCIMHYDTFLVRFVSQMPMYGAYSGCRDNDNAHSSGSYVWTIPGIADTNYYTYTWKDKSGRVLRNNYSSTGDTLYTSLPGVYYVSISSGTCDTTLTITLDLPDYHLAMSTDTVICIGDTSTFTNHSKGFTSYLWQFGDGAIAIQNVDDPNEAVPNMIHAYHQPGVYTVLLTGYPCGDSITQTIIVDSLPYLSFIADNTSMCEGVAVEFTVSHSTGIKDILWDYGDHTRAANIPSHPNVNQTQHAYDAAGIYTVSATAFFRACPATSFASNLEIFPYPTVDLGPDTSICLNNAGITLGNKNIAAASTHYKWSNGDTTRTIKVVHPAIYALILTTDKGCTSSDSITIIKSCYLNIPNAFTPDGDGNNDYFLPRLAGMSDVSSLTQQLTKYHMRILDRWGQLVFETNSINGRGWDGKYNSVDQSPGVYIYIVEAGLGNQQTEWYQGNLTLIR